MITKNMSDADAKQIERAAQDAYERAQEADRRGDNRAAAQSYSIALRGWERLNELNASDE